MGEFWIISSFFDRRYLELKSRRKGGDGVEKGKGSMGGWGLVVELVAGQSGCNHLRGREGERGEPAADARSELSLEKCFTRGEEEHTGNELKCCNDCDLYQEQSPCPLPSKSRT